MSEVVDGSGGKAHVLDDEPQPADRRRRARSSTAASREEHPKIVEGLVQGLLEGNRMVRDRPDQYLDVVGRAVQVEPRRHARPSSPRCTCRTCPRTSRSSPARSTPPAASAASTSRRCSPTAATSSRTRPTPSRFVDLAAPRRRSRRAASSRSRRSRSRRSAPARGARSKPIRCSARTSGSCSSRTPSTLDLSNQENLKNLEAIKRLLQVSPGSTLLLRGHVDNARVDDFRQQGGEAYVRTQALRAMELSKNRAARDPQAARRALQASTPSASTSSAAAGKSPSAPNSDQNRRVEVQWFTLE